MSPKKDTSIVRLVLFLAFFAASGSLAAAPLKPALARSPVTRSSAVVNDTMMQLDGGDGSSSRAASNQRFKQVPQARNTGGILAVVRNDQPALKTLLVESKGLVAIEHSLLLAENTADKTTTETQSGLSPWWLLLLLGIPLLWWLLKSRRQNDAVMPTAEDTSKTENAIALEPSPNAVTPPVTQAAELADDRTPDPAMVDLPTAIEPPLTQAAPPEAEATPPQTISVPQTTSVPETPVPETPVPETLVPESNGISEAIVLPGSAAMASGTADQGVNMQGKITLTPRGSGQAEAEWDIPDAQKATVQQRGGQSLKLRLYDVTNVDLSQKRPQSFQEFAAAEEASSATVTIQPDRDYMAEVGYITSDRYWLLLARSNSIRIPSPPPTETADNASGTDAALANGAALATLAALADDSTQAEVEATKYNVGQPDLSSEVLATVDDGLPGLPDGYGDSRIVLMPRDPQWGYVYWDAPNEAKEELRRQGGQRLALRLYDITDVGLTHQSAHSLQQYDCDELARDWYVPIPVSDRDYIAEIGYLTGDGRWLLLARSNAVRIPPVYPSEWFEDYFISVGWTEELRAKMLVNLVSPEKRIAATASPLYEQIFGMGQSTEAQRVAGSLFGSMQHVVGSGQQMPAEAISSYVFPSGISMGAAIGVPAPGSPLTAGLNMSGLNVSGLTMSGIGMSGIGFGASLPPLRARQFWLVADAELIVYGATETEATVTIDGRPIQLEPDGTFRFQMSFQDGVLNFPIIAVAADGEQSRSIHMTFNRDTPHRDTNTKDEAVDELF